MGTSAKRMRYLCFALLLTYFGLQIWFVHLNEYVTARSPAATSSFYNRFLQLRERGGTYKLFDYERTLVLQYWNLRRWLESLSKRLDSWTLAHVGLPPKPFPFDELQYNLWESAEEGDDRIVAQHVWWMQFLVQNWAVNQTFTTLNNVIQIHVGRFGDWEDWVLPVPWRRDGKVTNCGFQNLEHFGPQCVLTEKIPADWAVEVDAIATYGNNAVENLIRPGQIPPIATPWFKYLLEAPYLAPVPLQLSSQSMNTYLSQSPVPHKYMKWIYYDPVVRSKVQKINYRAGKSRMAAIFVSNCAPANNRSAYVTELQKYIQVDVYGACGPLSCQKRNPMECYAKLRDDYFFYLAFENSNCHDYVTEKLRANAYENFVVPIVMGAPPAYYHSNAPENSYIHVEEFESPRELAAYMQFVAENDSIYNSFFEWRGTGDFLVERAWFCRLCFMLEYHKSKQIPNKFGLQWLPDSILERTGSRLCAEKGHWFWDQPA